MAVTEKKILFLCTENAARSPMAEAILKRAAPDAAIFSAGVDSTQINPFAIAVMREQGIDLMNHESRSYEELGENGFDLIVALSRPAWDKARTVANGAAVEYWDLPDPPSLSGNENRDQIVEAYRRLRDDITRHIRNRFGIDA